MPVVEGNREEQLSNMAKAEMVIPFVEDNGTLPMAKRAAGSVEADAYKALARMRLLKRRGELGAEVSGALDAACPGWPDGNAFRMERDWKERRDELVQWMKVYKRLLTESSADAAERGLADLSPRIAALSIGKSSLYVLRY